MKEKDNLSRTIRMVASTIAMIAAFSVFSTTIFKTIFDVKGRPPTTERQSHQIDQLLNEMADQRTKIDSISTKISAFDNFPVGSELGVQVVKIRADFTAIDNRIKILEQAIMANPTVALSVPLLRKDLENLKNQYIQDRDTSSKYIDRIYDQNKWFIGLMFSMAVGLIGLAISNYLQAKKTKD